MEPEKNTIEQEEFPQYLCKMCGKCCRSITSNYTHAELEKMAEDGSDEARVFIDIFKPFLSIDEARKIVPEQIDQILEELKISENFDINKVTFYYCKHISDDNKCGIYNQRPECCKRAPNNGWSCMPPGCGFEGWQFEQREKTKQKVRKLKEYLVTARAIAEDGNIPGKNMTVKELEKIIEIKIKPWEKYGSKYW